MSLPVWFRYIALACACFIASGATWPIPILRELLLVGGLAAVGGAVAHGWKRRRDPYDLNALREFDEREELRNLDVPGVHDGDEIQCLNCMNVYAAKFPVCPHCKSAPGNRC